MSPVGPSKFLVQSTPYSYSSQPSTMPFTVDPSTVGPQKEPSIQRIYKKNFNRNNVIKCDDIYNALDSASMFVLPVSVKDKKASFTTNLLYTNLKTYIQINDADNYELLQKFLHTPKDIFVEANVQLLMTDNIPFKFEKISKFIIVACMPSAYGRNKNKKKAIEVYPQLVRMYIEIIKTFNHYYNNYNNLFDTNKTIVIPPLEVDEIPTESSVDALVDACTILNNEPTISNLTIVIPILYTGNKNDIKFCDQFFLKIERI